MKLEDISFKMIQQIGEAKFFAVEAFKEAKLKNFSKAYELIDKANGFINTAGSHHMEVIQNEANGNEVKITVFFMHAEDQFLSTQTFILSTKMMIEQIEIFYGEGK